jgi:hypothetical protein
MLATIYCGIDKDSNHISGEGCVLLLVLNVRRLYPNHILETISIIVGVSTLLLYVTFFDHLHGDGANI